MERFNEIVDAECVRVWIAAAVATGFSLAQLNVVLTTFILIGTAIYTWRKALRKGPPKDNDDEK